MKTAFFWDIKTQFVPHRKHYISATEPSRLILCEVWGFLGGDYVERGHLAFLSSLLRLLVTANVVPSSPILVALMMEAISSYERSVLTRVTRHHILDDDILQDFSWLSQSLEAILGAVP
jgi:hypothetical protein